jgi:hypothetical protein
VEAVDPAQLAVDGEEVEQRLGGMLTGAVAGAALSWRSTMTSAYASTMRMVSSRVSPLMALENSRAASVPITDPPRRTIADSKESRVRVLGS